VLRTSLDHTKEQALRDAIAGHAAATSAVPADAMIAAPGASGA
jgi:hypothetical protein